LALCLLLCPRNCSSCGKCFALMLETLMLHS
jgi:hypothetical protein